jgi:hypothetical protein
MKCRKRHDLVFAIYLQSHGFAFVLFEGRLAPVDWGAYDARGADKNARCLACIGSLLALHMPNVQVLQDTSDTGTRRANRIRALNAEIAELAHSAAFLVRTYSRAQIAEQFEQFGSVTKHGIAEATKHIPALVLYLPPARKPWISEDSRMGILAPPLWHGCISLGSTESSRLRDEGYDSC